jgi:hypothetical protein
MLMDSNKIEELLSKYWNCETSLEEEQQLREYFTGKEIPEQLKETANVFQYFEANKKKTLSDVTFEGEVLKKIKTPKGKMASLVYNAMRIAAGIAVLVVAIWVGRTEIRKTDPAATIDTYDDPKIAFEETKKALMMISKSFGTAETQAKKLNMFNEAQEEIQKKEQPDHKL